MSYNGGTPTDGNRKPASLLQAAGNDAMGLERVGNLDFRSPLPLVRYLFRNGPERSRVRRFCARPLWNV